MLTKSILVTGSNGLLGQKLVDRLAGRDAVNLIATSRGHNRNPNQEGYVYESLDVLDLDAIRAVFRQYEPTECIHTAAMTHVDRCEEDPDACRALNVTAVENLIQVCREMGTKIIHVSTDFIFDGTSGPYSEKDMPKPLSRYGNTKLEGERLVIESGIPFAVARTMLVYGVVADMSRSNIILWARKALSEGQEIQVVHDQFRSPTLAEDLADGIILIAMKEKTGIFHLSGPDTLSILDLVKEVADYWGFAPELIQAIDSSTLNQRAARPPRTGFIILKAQTELGYKPHSIREGLAIVDKQLSDYKV
ncbi:MAG TPA: SDR family oxidoreductase [Bacteroidetes bacterium]|nr:SDR family oxidoreductase [Bacteroidota bacterium]